MPVTKEREIEKIVKNKKCTGCSGCFNICPVGAISIKADKCGFPVPEIDYSKCINCGLCDKVCPIINEPNKSTQYDIPEVYAGWNRDEKVRMKSSSGGIFSLLAEYFLNKGGYVCGASFDEKNKLRHIIISDKKDLKKLQGSKYVQSEIGTTFKEIKNLLEKDCWVLFSGTPCQVAGLRNFLKKDYEKLLLVDIVCHGVPSPEIFSKYINILEKEFKCSLQNIEFRNKSVGWKDPQFTLYGINKEILSKKTLYDDVYGRGFLTNLFLRPSCTDCPFLKCPKSSDVTLGDFWGIWNFNKELDDNKGTSLIIVNNRKGLEFINKIKRRMRFIERVPLEIAINGNYPVYISSDKHVNSTEFFEEMKEGKQDIKELILKYLDDENEGVETNRDNVGLINFHYENHNFGANLVSYSLLKVVEKLGYKAKIINYNPFPEPSVIEKACSINFYKFRQDFLKMTKVCRTEIDLIKLNKQFGTFITGSDQVWRQAITGENALHYFLDFAFQSKKLLSYGASFGNNNWEGDPITTEKAKELLNRFVGISVREKEGLNILSEIFGVRKATYVLDPTLLLEENDYEEIINTEDYIVSNSKYIAYYFLFDNDGKIEKGKKIKEITKNLNLNIMNIKGKEELVGEKNRFVYYSIANFLRGIRDSEFIITDSYHGVLFSIIFKKDFICIGKESKALSRFEHLFSILGMDVKERFLSRIEDVNLKVLREKIDYKTVYKNLNREKMQSFNFLKKNLKKKDSSCDDFFITEEELLKEKINRINLESNMQEIENVKSGLLLQIENLNTENIDLKTNVNVQQGLIKSMENSKSWKITKPFRKLVRLFKLIKTQGLGITSKNVFIIIKNHLKKITDY